MKTLVFYKLLFFLLSLAGILALPNCSYLPEEQLVSDVLAVYETRNYIEITTNSGEFSKTGFVFYPGGLVDPHAYIEPLSRFAVSGIGHKVVIVKMPGNLAILDSKQGAYMFEDFPDVHRWVIGGHSLGGTAACSAVKKYPGYFEGLVLMAAYPSESTDLSDWTGAVLSIRGEFDHVLEPGIIEERASLLPDSTSYKIITGGNHALFGKYGAQKDDGQASVSFTDHTRETVKLIQELFNDHDWD